MQRNKNIKIWIKYYLENKVQNISNIVVTYSKFILLKIDIGIAFTVEFAKLKFIVN